MTGVCGRRFIRFWGVAKGGALLAQGAEFWTWPYWIREESWMIQGVGPGVFDLGRGSYLGRSLLGQCSGRSFTSLKGGATEGSHLTQEVEPQGLAPG